MSYKINDVKFGVAVIDCPHGRKMRCGDFNKRCPDYGAGKRKEIQLFKGRNALQAALDYVQEIAPSLTIYDVFMGNPEDRVYHVPSRSNHPAS